MMAFYIQYKIILGESLAHGDLQSTTIDATTKAVAIRKLERKLKTAWGLAYSGVKVISVSVGGYY